MEDLPNNDIITIRQLVNRLEGATAANERVDSLNRLQALARQYPEEVGQYAMAPLLELLHEQTGYEEYMEALDLLSRLITSKNAAAAASNTTLILGEPTQGASIADLLLELLGHEDMTVGVMASQILMELHTRAGTALEKSIQACPEGMTKLLNLLPDSGREAVRNQAIVLVLQLTAKNEEMKKTLAFNEGFEILFRIMNSEGGSEDGGLVIQDCLKIVRNILTESEICQRLFYGTGENWHLGLSKFFSPAVESYVLNDLIFEETDDDPSGPNSPPHARIGTPGRAPSLLTPWFDSENHITCGTIALETLKNSLLCTEIINSDHQRALVASNASAVICSAHWLARRGPIEFMIPAINFLKMVVSGNNQTAAAAFAAIELNVPWAERGRSLPHSRAVSDSRLQFGIDVDLQDGNNSNNNDKNIANTSYTRISLVSLLAELFIVDRRVKFGSNGSAPANSYFWCVHDPKVPSGIGCPVSVSKEIEVRRACMELLDSILEADETASVLILQHVLAPPLPSLDENDIDATPPVILEPLGVKLLSGLLGGCMVIGQGSSVPGCLVPFATVLTMVLVHGDVLAREIASAITLAHPSLAGHHGTTSDSALLPYLLDSTIAALSVIDYLPVATALFQLLTAATVGCSRASLSLESCDHEAVFDFIDKKTDVQINKDPSLVMARSAAALYISSWALAKSEIQQRERLHQINSRFGLPKYLSILESGLRSGLVETDILVCSGFMNFYEAQVEATRSAVFSFFSNTAEPPSLPTPAPALAPAPIPAPVSTEIDGPFSKINGNAAVIDGPFAPAVLLGTQSSSNSNSGGPFGDATPSDEIFGLLPPQTETVVPPSAPVSLSNNKSAARIEELETALAVAEARVRVLTADTEHHYSELETLRRHSEDVARNARTEVDSLKEGHLVLEREKDELSNELDRSRRKESILEEQMTAKDEEIKALQSKIDEKKHEENENLTTNDRFTNAPINVNGLSEKQMSDLRASIAMTGPSESDGVTVDAELWADSLWPSLVETLEQLDTAVGLNRIPEGIEDPNEVSYARQQFYVELASTTGAQSELEGDLVGQMELILSALTDCADGLYASADACCDVLQDHQTRYETSATITYKEPQGTAARMVEVAKMLSAEAGLRLEESVRFRRQLEECERDLQAKDMDMKRLEAENERSNIGGATNANTTTNTAKINTEYGPFGPPSAASDLFGASAPGDAIFPPSSNPSPPNSNSNDENIPQQNTQRIVELEEQLSEISHLLSERSASLDMLRSIQAREREETQEIQRQAVALVEQSDAQVAKMETAIATMTSNIPEKNAARIAELEAQLQQFMHQEEQRLQKPNMTTTGVDASFGYEEELRELKVEMSNVSAELKETEKALDKSRSHVSELEQQLVAVKAVAASLEQQVATPPPKALPMRKSEPIQDAAALFGAPPTDNIQSYHPTINANADAASLFGGPTTIASTHPHTPPKPANFIKGVGGYGGTPGSTMKGFLSPTSGKRMAHLHAELQAERKRLYELQDEHTDLLGLIAQQEIELDAFRNELVSSAGDQAVLNAERAAETAAIDRYGFYNDFRRSPSSPEQSISVADMSSFLRATDNRINE